MPNLEIVYRVGTTRARLWHFALSRPADRPRPGVTRYIRRRAALPSLLRHAAVRAESDLAAGKCDLIAVGRPILANPDLVARWNTGAATNAPDFSTFYTPVPKDYTDYPALG